MVPLYPQKLRADSMLYSRIKALEKEVRTIKALAMSEDKVQDHKRRDKLVKGVRRAKRMEAAAQKIAITKGCKHNIRTQDLQKSDALVRSSSRAIQHASSLHASRCTDESKYSSTRDIFGSKHKDTQEPDADPQQSQANKAEQATAGSSLRAT